MSREARGALLVLALLAAVTLGLVLRRRAQEAAAATAEPPALTPLAVQDGPDLRPAEEPPGPSLPAAADEPPRPGDGATPRDAPAQDSPGLTLRGRVVDPAGRPVAGASIVCPEADPQTVATATDGSFACEGIRPGDLGPRWARVDLEASAGGARGQRHGVVVGPDQQPIEVVLRPPARMHAQVRSSGASVYLRAVLHADGARPRYRHSQGGELDLLCQEGDWVEVVAVAPGHAPRRFALRAPSPEVVVHLSRAGAGALRGRVVEHDGAPAQRVQLRVSSGPAVDDDASAGPASPGLVEERPLGRISGDGWTRDDGSFTIDGLAEGTRVHVLLSRESASPLARPGALDEPTLALEATVGDDELLVTLPRPGAHRVMLRPIAAESGQPLLDAITSEVARGGAPGVRVIDLPGPGEHTVFIQAPDRLSRTLRVTLDREETRDLGDVPLDPPGRLLLTLRWPEAPVEALWLTWTDARGEPGRSELPPSVAAPVVVPCAPGSRGFTLHARRPGGQRQVVSFDATVVAGQETAVEVDLTSAPVLAPE